MELLHSFELECAWRQAKEPRVEKAPPSIREALAQFVNECARRSGESHILKTTRHPSVKL